jgi:hypothetical protein
MVEIDAKKAAGYYAEAVPSEAERAATKGRALEDYGAS